MVKIPSLQTNELHLNPNKPEESKLSVPKWPKIKNTKP